MKLVLSSIAGGIATITLNRPEKLNALIGTMRQDLSTALREAGRDPAVRVIVITGTGRGFCAGGDVEFMAQLQRDGNTAEFETLLDTGADVVTTIRGLPKPVIARVNGIAAGAGCNLALACDYRIAAASAKIGATFARIGLHADWGGTFFLPRLIGTSRALELLMTGRLADSAEALELGLFDRVVPDASLDHEVDALAQTIATGPPGVIQDLKRAIYLSEKNSLQDQLALERQHQLRAFAAADAREGINAFLEKRPARFNDID